MVDSTVFPKKSVSFFMELNKPSQAQHKSQYCLSLSGENVVAKVSKFIFSAFKFTLLLASFIQLIEYDTFLLIFGKTAPACS